MNKIKILYLYSELVGYQIPIFKEYVETYKADVHVMSWDKKKIKPYEPEAIYGVTYYKRSKYNNSDILALALSLNPDIIYISGWMDKGYLFVTEKMKKRGIPIVTAFDDIWVGSFRQRIGSLVFPFFFKKYFSHAWVAGSYQFEFAKKMGFKNNEIIYDMLSADTTIFNLNHYLLEKNKDSQKSFLYVGNFRKVKGVDILLEAFDIYLKKYNGNWKLTCVGNGELEPNLKENKNIEVIPFSTSNEIVEISKRNDVFILPSRHDQWGVVVHEFSCIGMPLLLSENVGAKTTFFINGFNGYQFNKNSAEHLAKMMFRFEQLDDIDLKKMGKNSQILAQKINVATSAANFISILKK